MGIPSYFSHLIKKNAQLVIKNVSGCTRLFLDLNGVIHTTSRNVIGELKTKLEGHMVKSKKTPFEMEKWIETNKSALNSKIYTAIFNSVVEYIDFLCVSTNPSKLLYVAIDGVAPMAKINQQRMRRFRSHKEKLIKNKLYQKHGKFNLEALLWDSNIITPGTPFMLELSDHIKTHLRNHLHLSKEVEIIFSDSLVKGEGEHKIVEYIRTHHTVPNQTDLIHGLDADLIMLSLGLLTAPNCPADYSIYLVRETLEFGTHIVNDENDNPVLCYFDILCLKRAILEYIANKGVCFQSDEMAWIRDYVCICFLLGNDFLPHPVTLHISDGAIEQLIDKYTYLYRNRSIHLVTPELDLEMSVLLELISLVYQEENGHMYEYVKKMSNYRYREKEGLSIFEKEIDKIQQVRNRRMEKAMLHQFENWKKMYYRDIGAITSAEEEMDMKKQYIKGVYWCLQYYFKGCVSDNWYYPYMVTPTFEDLRSFLIEGQTTGFQPKKQFQNQITNEKEINVYVQQLMVLPTSSHAYIHPMLKECADTIELALYFPEDFEVNTFCKRFLWESYPIIPRVDIDVFIEKTQQCIGQMTVKEKKLVERFQSCVL